MNQALRALGKKIAAKSGIRPLRPGQMRPVGFYMVNHATGEPIIRDRNAVVMEHVEPDVHKAGEPRG